MIQDIKKSVDEIYAKLHPADGPLGVLGPPGAGCPAPPAYWDVALQEEPRLLLESIYGLQLCLDTLRRQWIKNHQNLPTEKIVAKVYTSLGPITKEIEIKLIPSVQNTDWQPHGLTVKLGFLVETVDGKYEVDNYPANPVAYPKSSSRA